MGNITVVFGAGVAVATIASYNGSTGKYEYNSYYSTTTFSNNNTSRYIEVTYVGAKTGYTNATSNKWGPVYFPSSGTTYIGLSAEEDITTPTYTLKFSIGAGVKKVYYNYYAGSTLEYSSSFSEGETRDWTFSEYDGSKRRSVTLWVETADLYAGYTTPIHNVGTYYWNSNQTKVISATQSSEPVTITFNANGGSDAPSSITATAGYVTIPSETPTRSGYAFIGWSTDQNATTAQTTAGASYYVDSDTTLYAVWRKIITLYYDQNGGSGAPQSSTGHADSDGYVTFTITDSVPTKEGATFNGWWLPDDESPRWGGSTLRLSSDATLTAAWIVSTYNVYGYPSTGVASFSIQYTAANGNTVSKTFNSSNYGTSVPVKAGTVISFSSCTLSDSTYYTNPIANFCTDIDYPDSTSIETYSASSSFTSHAINSSQNIQLKASIIQVTLSFDANGGTDPPSSITQNIRTEFTIPLKVPTKSGYTFNGWYIYPDGETPYWGNNKITLTRDTVMKAAWRVTTYNVYFWCSSPVTSYSITYTPANGNAVTRTINLLNSGVSYEIKHNTTIVFNSVTYNPGYENPIAKFYADADYPSVLIASYDASSSFTSHTITQSQNMRIDVTHITISLFYWHDEGDASYFQSGLPVKDALTAAAWNSIKQKIIDVRKAYQQNAPLLVTVSSGDEITAAEFNNVRVQISNTENSGTLPGAVSPGDTILPGMFNGSGSLKAALNASIMALNEL